MSVQAAPATPAAAAPVFRPLTVTLMVLAGVFAFSAYFVLSAFAPDMRGAGDDGGANALSRSAIGFAGVVRLLQADGVADEIDRKGAGHRNPNWSLLVVTPPEDAKPADVFALATPNAATLVVMPKWEAQPDDDNPGWVRQMGLASPDALKAMLAGQVAAVFAQRSDTAPALLGSTDTSLPSLQTGPIAHLQTVTAPGWTTILSDASGASVLIRSPDSRVFVLSDPDLLNTQGIKALPTATAGVDLIQMLRQGQGPVAFDVSLNGYKASQKNALKLAFQPPFLGATLALAGVALLMGFHAISRFGAAQRSSRALALGKRALAENSAGLIRMARREPHMAAGYLDLNRAAVAKALGARTSGPELDAYIDRVGERANLGSLSALSAEVPLVHDRDSLTRFAQRLYQWRLEMTRERR